MELDKTQLQWLLAGIGAVVVALIYLWGIRARLKEEIRKRRRRSSLTKEPRLGETATHPPGEGGGEIHEFGELGRITSDHHLADKALVDVEIRPLNRGADSERAPSPADRSSSESITRAFGRPEQTSFAGESPLGTTAQPSTRPEQAPSADTSPFKTAAWPFDREPDASWPVKSGAEPSRESVAPSAPKMTVALTVMAPRHQSFKGVDIEAAAGEAQLRLGGAGLFERYLDGATAADTPVFSVAHLRKPGSFEPWALAELTTPGLLLFMRLPGPVEGMKALELLLLAADQLARQLGGVICDEHRNKMTNQGLIKLRDQVADLERER